MVIMKKILTLLVMSLAFVAFCGCTNETIPETETVADYFSISENTHYVYEGQGMEYAAYDVYAEFIADNKVQQRVDNGGTVMAKIVEIANGKVTETFAKEDAYYRINFLDEGGNKDEILLMEPLETGTTWTLADGRVRTITATEAAVSTPAGDYTALEVTTEGTDSTIVQYYAKDVGLVKSVFVSGDAQIVSALSRIETDVPFTQMVRFYYPNIEDSRIYWTARAIDFYTNASNAEVLAAAYKEDVPTQMGTVFSEGTAINDLYLDNNGMVHIDLTTDFVSEMNAGGEFEAMILQAVADTFGNYYNAEKVMLTVEGAPYSSGHFMFEADEYLTADLASTVAISE
jgi:hypothetical protein